LPNAGRYRKSSEAVGTNRNLPEPVGPRRNPSEPFVSVAVALGSNLGDRLAHLTFATDALARVVRGLCVSSFIETDPMEVPEGQPRYLNGAATGDTDLSARSLLDTLLAIEQARGRERPSAMAPRTLDLDVILYGAKLIDETGLRVPHPRFRQRMFVLEPLAEIAGEWVDPETGRTIRELLRALGTQQPVVRAEATAATLRRV